MAHIALATKYRPRSFADVATQEHVSETLRSAVATGRVGHAYLFCGPRGVGKTTLARVLAMALNCPNRSADGEPCGECESCRRIWGGHTALDVVEIDAASNRGVDDARDLRERAMYAPSAEGRHKVYIVDEAHMLTREAWNALLKILEEPPPRVIFVFATTEPQKIAQSAAPILSRCQRFDFRRIGVSDIVTRLKGVLEKEGVNASEDALRIVARKADGGMRDALSQLDQVMSLTGGEIDADSVRRVLGLVEEERYLELLDILREGRHGDVFELVDRLVDEGYDLVEFYHGLLDMLRVVLRLRLSPDADVDLKEGLRADLLERASSFEPTDLVRMLASAAELESLGSLRRSPNPRVPIEMLLLRMSYMDRTVSFEELIGALGGSGTPGGPAGSGGAGAPAGGTTTSSSGAAPRRAAKAAPKPSKKGTENAADEAEPWREATGREPVPAPAAGQPFGAVSPAGPPIAASPASTPTETLVAATTELPTVEGNGHARGTLSAAEAWQQWLDHGPGVPKGLGSFLRAATVTDGPEGQVLVSGVPAPADERLAEPVVQHAIRDGLARRLGRVPDLVVVGPASHAADGASPAPTKPQRVTQAEVRQQALEALFRQEPRLQKAVEELDLELMD